MHMTIITIMDHRRGIGRWLFSTNHKDIGTLYLLFSLAMLFIGGSMAMVIRAELFSPGLQFVDPHFFNQMTTMHALVMIFGAVMPGFVGFANWMLPLMVGAPDMALPRLNNMSFWVLFMGLRAVAVYSAGWCTCWWLDHVRTAVDSGRDGDRYDDLRRSHDGYLVDPRRD